MPQLLQPWHPMSHDHSSTHTPASCAGSGKLNVTGSSHISTAPQLRKSAFKTRQLLHVVAREGKGSADRRATTAPSKAIRDVVEKLRCED